MKLILLLFSKKNKIIFIFGMLLICFIYQLDAQTKHYSTYGSTRTEPTITCVSEGSKHNFEVDKITANKNTEWYLDGGYTGEPYNDWSGVLANDPDQTFTVNSNCKIEAVVYDNNWKFIERHIWNVTVAITPSTPSGVDASDGTYCDKVVVTWNSASNATSYDVYRSSTFLGNTTSTSYTDNNVTIPDYTVPPIPDESVPPIPD